MRKLACYLILILLISINAQAAFEKKQISVINQALGDSASTIFSYQNGLRELSIGRNTIVPSMLESTRYGYMQRTKDFVFGFYYCSFGAPDITTDLSYVEKTIAAKINYPFGSRVVLGGEIKRNFIRGRYNGSSLAGDGVTIDLGVKFIFAPSLNIILERTNLGGSIRYNTGKLEDSDGSTNLIIEKNLGESSIAFLRIDQDRKTNIGCQVNLHDQLSLLLGNSQGDWAGGVIIKKDDWNLEYACSYNLLGTQQSLGLSRAF